MFHLGLFDFAMKWQKRQALLAWSRKR